jgi:hypothetical protein
MNAGRKRPARRVVVGVSRLPANRAALRWAAEAAAMRDLPLLLVRALVGELMVFEEAAEVGVLAVGGVRGDPADG